MPLIDEIKFGGSTQFPACLNALLNGPDVTVGAVLMDSSRKQKFVVAMRKSKITEPHPAIEELRREGFSEDFEKQLIDSFVAWEKEGPNKESWTLIALGWFGGDRAAMTLGPRVPEYPGSGQHRRALTAMEVLQNIGTDMALFQLARIAEQASSRHKLRDLSYEAFEAIAKQRGVTVAELEDIVIPDCGLGPGGTMSFDYGPRQFELRMGADLKPKVMEDSGKLKANLPKPTKKDDPEKASRELERWKTFKEALKKTIKPQGKRYEKMMVSERTWNPAQWQRDVIGHPLMIHIARTLIWLALDENQKMIGSFRIDEEGMPVDAEEEEFSLANAAGIRITHPARLTEEVRNAWGEVLADYEIIPPFAQFSREIHAPTPEELNGTEVKRFGPGKMEGMITQRILSNKGFENIYFGVEDRNRKPLIYKRFPASNTTLVLDYDLSGPWETMFDWDAPELKSAYFVRDDDPAALIPLKDVDPVAFSEAVRDIAAVQEER